jgi:hypothetical protein
MKNETTPVLNTSFTGISGIEGLPALAATHPDELAEAIFKRRMMLLDLLMQRITVSDNPKIVSSYIKLLDDFSRAIEAD